MKKTILLAMIAAGSFIFTGASAQLRINVNIGSQPVWGPTGYDHVDYYYLPDIDAYYDVPNRRYIYMEGRQWRFASSLPARFGNYDIYKGYKVVVNEPKPYNRGSYYRNKYAGYKGRHDQEIIRNSHEQKYFQIKDHPEHNKWKNDNDKDKHRKNDHSRDNNGHH